MIHIIFIFLIYIDIKFNGINYILYICVMKVTLCLTILLYFELNTPGTVSRNGDSLRRIGIFRSIFTDLLVHTFFCCRKPVEYFIFHFISRNKKYFQISLNYCKITPVLYLTKPVPFPGPGPFNLDCLLCRVFCLWICPFVCLSICLSSFDPTYRLQ